MLKEYSDKNKTLFYNHSEIDFSLIEDYKKVVVLNPVEKVLENLEYIPLKFKDYISEMHEQYDVVFSSSQDNHLEPNDMMLSYYGLIKNGGIMIYKIKKEFDEMIDVLKNKFDSYEKINNYYVFKKC